MKKMVILAALLCTTSVMAAEFRPYIGGSYQHAFVNYDSSVEPFLDDSLPGGEIHAGLQFTRNWGVEASYLSTTTGDGNAFGLPTEVKVSGFALDLMGAMPVSDHVDLIGTVGVSRLKGEVSIPGASDNSWETKGRVGVGAQYWFMPNVNVRALVRYQDADFDGAVDNAILTSVGLNYQF